MKIGIIGSGDVGQRLADGFIDQENGRAVDISGVLEADLKISSRNANSSVKKIWISGIPGKNGKIVYFKKPTQ
jgi:hypothetical protein